MSAAPVAAMHSTRTPRRSLRNSRSETRSEHAAQASDGLAHACAACSLRWSENGKAPAEPAGACGSNGRQSPSILLAVATFAEAQSLAVAAVFLASALTGIALISAAGTNAKAGAGAAVLASAALAKAKSRSISPTALSIARPVAAITATLSCIAAGAKCLPGAAIASSVSNRQRSRVVLTVARCFPGELHELQILLGDQQAVGVQVVASELIEAPATAPPFVETNLPVFVRVQFIPPRGEFLRQLADAVHNGPTILVILLWRRRLTRVGLIVGRCVRVRAAGIVRAVVAVVALGRPCRHVALVLVEVDEAVLVRIPLVALVLEPLGHFLKAEHAILVAVHPPEERLGLRIGLAVATAPAHWGGDHDAVTAAISVTTSVSFTSPRPTWAAAQTWGAARTTRTAPAAEPQHHPSAASGRPATAATGAHLRELIHHLSVLLARNLAIGDVQLRGPEVKHALAALVKLGANYYVLSLGEHVEHRAGVESATSHPAPESTRPLAKEERGTKQSSRRQEEKAVLYAHGILPKGICHTYSNPHSHVLSPRFSASLILSSLVDSKQWIRR